MNKEDITILIAGKLCETSIHNLELYNQYKEVIISYWSSDDTSLIDDTILQKDLFINSNYDFIKLQENASVSREAQSYNNSVFHQMGSFCPTFYYQVANIVFGLRKVKTKYVIRTRADEIFTNLDPLIEKFELDTGKFVGANVFWKPLDVWGKYHIGDHLFMCETDKILQTYENIFKSLLKGAAPLVNLFEDKDYYPDPNFWTDQLLHNPENTLGIYYLDALGLDLNECLDTYYEQKLLQNFDVLNVELLGSYVVRYGQSEKVWVSNDSFGRKFSAKYAYFGLPSFNKVQAWQTQCVQENINEVLQRINDNAV